jgi:HEAT repeat protein
MTITHIATVSTLVLALAAPLAAQTPEPAWPVAPAVPAPPAPPAAPIALVAPFLVEAPQPPAIVSLYAQAQTPESGESRGTGRGRGAGAFRTAPPLPPLPPDPQALYDQARDAIDNNRFDQALRELKQLTDQGWWVGKDQPNWGDAALYWKAYSESKLALNDEALETIKELSKQFAKSNWAKDAKALAIEIQQSVGQPVSAELQNDEELKLLALRGVMQTEPDRGLPIIEKMLAGGATPRVRDRALFVLAQSQSPKAREIIATTARNNANPELQVRAIRYIGMMRTGDSADLLGGIYRSSTDPSVKRAIIQSYFQNGNADRIGELAKTEKDSDLRRLAIRDLGMMNRAGTNETLVAIYKSDSSTDVRREVVNALFIHREARALVDLARVEKDPSLKREIVSKLSVMKAPEATDYMLELLK